MCKKFMTFAASSNPIKIIILFFMMWEVTGFFNYDDDKRQIVIPYSRIGRSSWSWLEDKRQGLIPFPRVGRTSQKMSEDKRVVLVPFPQVDQPEEKDVQLTLIPRQLIPSPRFGRSFTSGIGRHVLVWPDPLFVGDKQSLFTPTIGRDLVTSHLSRTDDDSNTQGIK
ncbi:uncharacterized protein LOC143227250 [Tachypleus tridentatus]|uniref:uncharacterized protein LOC143227250 n=1 Tax=Tachypleus tridentatus TaxID=6853 RepID=UPI003FCF40FB